MQTLEQRYRSDSNAMAVMRVSAALGVLLAHCWPLGFGEGSPGNRLSRGQTDLGSLSLDVLFIVSGFLNTDSALRGSSPRFLWKRFLRLFPGFWVCLLVTAFVIAPIVAWKENGSLAGFWSHSDGPFDYVIVNWFMSMNQFTIAGLLSTTPFGQLSGGPSAFNGSLWTLRYEVGCFVLLAILLGSGALRRARWVVPAMVAIAFTLIAADTVRASSWTIRPPDRGALGPILVFGTFEARWVLYLGFLFLLGSAARLYCSRVPIDMRLALAAAAIAIVTFRFGGWLMLGLPSYAYLVIFAGVTLPSRLHRIGRTNDYTYGIYIYAFPIQQAAALFGAADHGKLLYIVVTVVLTAALAILSWHLVEHPAMGWRNAFDASSRRQVAGVGGEPGG